MALTPAMHRNMSSFGRLWKELRKDWDYLTPEERDVKLAEIKKLDEEWLGFPEQERRDAQNFYNPQRPLAQPELQFGSAF